MINHQQVKGVVLSRAQKTTTTAKTITESSGHSSKEAKFKIVSTPFSQIPLRLVISLTFSSPRPTTTEGYEDTTVRVSKQSATTKATRSKGSAQSKNRETDEEIICTCSSSRSEGRTISEERFSTSTTRSANVAGRSEDTDCSVVNRKQDLPNQGNPQSRPSESPKARRGASLDCLAADRAPNSGRQAPT